MDKNLGNVQVSGDVSCQDSVHGTGHETYRDWLKVRSILQKNQHYQALFSAHSRQWRCPFGRSGHSHILAERSVWLSTYPDSVIGPDDEMPLQTLGDPALLDALSQIGILGIHTGPMKRSGAVTGKDYSPSIDGHFDRIECRIDPNYGTEAAYKAFVQTAQARDIAIIGDIIPGHTGKGPDFRLAEMNDPDYRGIYNMLEIDPDDWPLLPDIAAGKDSQNLSVEHAMGLRQAGYPIVGPLDVEVFARPGIKETSFSATDIIEGVDGVKRRWVYLHIFKEGQPSLNWMDPSFGAYRLVTADTLHTLHDLGVKGLRLDATMFLGVEPRSGDAPGWLGGHPLSHHVTDCLGMMIRKFGGFSFQELNTDFVTMRESLGSGPEFNYDFPTRPSYLYALTTEDAGPLRLTLREMLAHDLQLNRFVHALQNHDELMLEAIHYAVHGDKDFNYESVSIKGRDLFAKIHETVTEKTVGPATAYNHPFGMSPGICSTLTGFIAAGLNIKDIKALSKAQIEQIKRRHLLAAAFNALQGGVFAVSAWDLLGALPVDSSQVAELMADNDARWINRGGYDLMNRNPSAQKSMVGLPRAVALYGDLATQLQDPNSFAVQLQTILDVRAHYRVSESVLVDVPEVEHAGILIMRHAIQGRILLSAFNFSGTPVRQGVSLGDVQGDVHQVWSLQDGMQYVAPVKPDGGQFFIDLPAYDAQLHICKG